MKNESLKIGVLGLGLIGGSILKALHELQKYHLVAVSKSSYMEAKEYAGIASDNINSLKDCDVVFVCSKMADTTKILSDLENILSNKTIVTDVCSIKGFLDSNYRFNFIPSHPMAGNEFSGFKNSDSKLFCGAKWIIGKENVIIENLICEMGAKPVLIGPIEHDKMAAQISHLPMLISTALFDMAEDNSKQIASSGFRDTTRLAMTNPDLAYDMVQFNKENILEAYEKFKESFERIINLNEEEFKTLSKDIAYKRSKMYDKDGKNKL